MAKQNTSDKKWTASEIKAPGVSVICMTVPIPDSQDPEIVAIGVCVYLLGEWRYLGNEPLDGAARERILSYLLSRFKP